MNSKNSYQKRIHRVLRYIEEHLDSVPSLNELANIAHFSPFHFHRIFTYMMGESVAAYIRRLKLQKAASRLSYSKDALILIAFEAGYDSPEAFSRAAFRAVFGVSPSQYRKKSGGAFSIKMTRVLNTNLEDICMEVKVKVIKPFLVAAMRYVGPYQNSHSAWLHLKALLSTAGLLTNESIAYAICYDDPDVTPAEKCRMDVCFSLPKGVNEKTPVLANLLRTTELFTQKMGSGGEYACLSVKGSYRHILLAYRYFFSEWLPKSGRELGERPDFEAYYNDPDNTPEEELLSELFIPLNSLN